jgi:hypothetical protein
MSGTTTTATTTKSSSIGPTATNRIGRRIIIVHPTE